MVTPSAAGEGQAPNGVSATALDILAKAGIGTQPGTGQGAKDPGGEQPPSELTVDLGDGVQRTVKVEDLVGAFRSREQTAALNAALDSKMRQFGDVEGIQEMRERIGKMKPAHRAKVLEILQDPDVLDGNEQAETEDGGDEDAADQVVQRLQGKQPRVNRKAGTVEIDAAEYEQLKQVVLHLAGAEQTRMESGRKQSMAEQVRTTMASYPLFKGPENAVAASLAEDAVLAQLTADPAVGVENAVKSVARKLHAMQTKAQQTMLDEAGITHPSVLPQPPKGGFRGANSLANGGPARAARQALNGR